MSSITSLARRLRSLLAPSRRSTSDSGQILVLFAGGLIAMIAIAALVFDVGQSLLDRRTEQDAADAAALAGSRYIPGNTATYQGPCPAPAGNKPATAACNAAKANGFQNGVNGVTVEVEIPPGPESNFQGLIQYVEVRIGNTRPSIFAGVLGAATQRTGAIATATNASGVNVPFGLLALDPTSCGVSKVNGNGGTITLNAAIHVDSSCPTDALLLTGGGVISAPSCETVGGFQVQGTSTDNCATTTTGATVSGDPLKSLPAPAEPPLGNVTLLVKGAPSAKIPSACLGGTAPTSDLVPLPCIFPSSLSGSVFRLSPGYYPGGLQFNAGTFYLDPGIYWIGGGGFSVNGATVLSTNAGGTTLGGGILVYNTQDPNYATQCAANRTFPAGTVAAHPSVSGAGACYSNISLAGTSSVVSLLPIQNTVYKNMVFFVDRTLSYRTSTPSSTAADIQLNGNQASLNITGTIYDPLGLVILNGDTADQYSSQVIAYDFQVNGNGAGMNINYDGTKLFQLSGTGLVE